MAECKFKPKILQWIPTVSGTVCWRYRSEQRSLLVCGKLLTLIQHKDSMDCPKVPQTVATWKHILTATVFYHNSCFRQPGQKYLLKLYTLAKGFPALDCPGDSMTSCSFWLFFIQSVSFVVSLRYSTKKDPKYAFFCLTFENHPSVLMRVKQASYSQTLFRRSILPIVSWWLGFPCTE